MELQPTSIDSPALPSKISLETVGSAVDALLKWIKSQPKYQKAQLFEHDEFVYLILTIKKIPPKGRTNPYKVPLPNPFHPFDSSEELCLIIDDRSKSTLTSEAAKKKIQSENIPVSKVLKLSKLKSNYRPFEAKRKLCSSYDLFFADKRIIPLLPRQLGKEFFKKKKLPIPVDLTKKNWKEQIQFSCQSALLFLRTGTCSVIKVGRISQSRDEIVANVAAAIDGVAEIVPKKWGNIRAFHLKLTDSLALPIYQTVPDVGLKIEGARKHEEEKKVDSQAESGEESLGEEKGKKLGKSKKKRGRIHEVRYMDNGEIIDDMFIDKDNDDACNGNVAADDAVLTGKKRKKMPKGEAVTKKSAIQSEGKGGEKANGEELVGDAPGSVETKKVTKLKQKGSSTGKKQKVALSPKGNGSEVERVNEEELVGDAPGSVETKKAAKLKQKGSSIGKKKKVALSPKGNGSEVERANDEELVGDAPGSLETKKAAKSKPKGSSTGKKKKVSLSAKSNGSEVEQVNDEKMVGDAPVSIEIKKAEKLKPKGSTEKKKKVALPGKSNGSEVDADGASDGDKSVSSDLKKKKKSTVSSGMKLRSKRTRE